MSNLQQAEPVRKPHLQNGSMQPQAVQRAAGKSMAPPPQPRAPHAAAPPSRYPFLYQSVSGRCCWLARLVSFMCNAVAHRICCCASSCSCRFAAIETNIEASMLTHIQRCMWRILSTLALEHLRQSTVNAMASHYSLFPADADSPLLPSLLRCGLHPLHQVPTPHVAPQCTLPQARLRRKRHLLLSEVFRTLQPAGQTSLPRPHCLTRNLPRASPGTARQQSQQVSAHPLLRMSKLKQEVRIAHVWVAWVWCIGASGGE